MTTQPPDTVSLAQDHDQHEENLTQAGGWMAWSWSLVGDMQRQGLECCYLVTCIKECTEKNASLQSYIYYISASSDHILNFLCLSPIGYH